jgi:hypothetical protein
LARAVGVAVDGRAHLGSGRVAAAIAAEHAVAQLRLDDSVLDEPLKNGFTVLHRFLCGTINRDENLSAVTHASVSQR